MVMLVYGICRLRTTSLERIATQFTITITGNSVQKVQHLNFIGKNLNLFSNNSIQKGPLSLDFYIKIN